jgi:hypothetical protein
MKFVVCVQIQRTNKNASKVQFTFNLYLIIAIDYQFVGNSCAMKSLAQNLGDDKRVVLVDADRQHYDNHRHSSAGSHSDFLNNDDSLIIKNLAYER